MHAIIKMQSSKVFSYS